MEERCDCSIKNIREASTLAKVKCGDDDIDVHVWTSKER